MFYSVIKFFILGPSRGLCSHILCSWRIGKCFTEKCTERCCFFEGGVGEGVGGGLAIQVQ